MFCTLIACTLLVGSSGVAETSDPISKAMVNYIIELADMGDVEMMICEVGKLGDFLDSLKLSSAEKLQVFASMLAEINRRYGTDYVESEVISMLKKSMSEYITIPEN